MPKPDPVQGGQRRLTEVAFLSGLAPEIERVTVMRLRGQRDIVDRGEVEQQRGDLKRARQPERAAAIRRHAGDVLTRKANGAGMRKQLPNQLADQRGLAGAVRSDDRVQFATRNIQRDVNSYDDPAKPPDQIFNAKQGISHDAASPTGQKCRRARTARSTAADKRSRRSSDRTANPCRRG